MTWPFWLKLTGTGAGVLLLAGGGTWAAIGFTGHALGSPPPVRPDPQSPVPSYSAVEAPPTQAPVSQPPSGLAAACQVGSDGQPASQQNYDTGGLDYLIAVTNGTSNPVTVTGYTVTFSAFGNQAVDAETPSINTTLMEPGEKWTYTGNYSNAPQVSENTYLNETCTVTEVDTDAGPVVPNAVNEPNGQQNTQQQNIADAQSKLSSDTSALQQDAGMSQDVNRIAADVQTTDHDLAATRSDAANGNGDQCINASTTVYNDAATTVLNDVVTTVLNDVGTVASDITQVRKDITAVQSDAAALANSGGQPTSDPSPVISSAQAAVASAISTVNPEIDHANGDLAAAYQGADSVGTGSCQGDGPGSPPSGVGYLK